ncbi:MAG: FKBP-type peptidyl-prolyl cis-trans isomerase [Isosphaeraceae bacterium]
MKYSIVAATGLGLVVVSSLAAAQGTPKAAQAGTPTQAGAPPAGLSDLRSQASYGLGLNIGRNLKSQSVDLDGDLLARGIKDGLAGSKPLLSDEQIEKAVQAFQQELIAKRQTELKGIAEKNKKEGDAFLAQNKSKPGVQTTKSGLQFKVVKEGTGAIPKETDQVTAHYRGTLLDGTEFDNSYKRGQPLVIPVDGVIPGWTEALKMMKVGSKWQLFIPAALAYGENPREGSPIPPNAVLLFDIELLGIGKPAAAPPGGAPPAGR